MKPRAIEVQIDELVLHGFAPRDRHVLAEALQCELTRLLETRGLPRTPGASAQRDAVRPGPIALPAAPRAATTGIAIARAIFGGLSA